MSGTGKSYWSKQLEIKGFKRFCCDDLIEKKLGKELTSLGYHGIEDVAKWMGQPFDSQYEKTNTRYLELEQQTLEESLAIIEKSDENNNIVIDTTGSVIYLDEKVLQKLSQITTIVYLAIPESVKEEMYQLYLREPKPRIWGDSFNRKPGETNLEALKRCYPEWLAYRTKHYEKLAYVTLDYFELRKYAFTVDDFLSKIKI